MLGSIPGRKSGNASCLAPPCPLLSMLGWEEGRAARAGCAARAKTAGHSQAVRSTLKAQGGGRGRWGKAKGKGQWGESATCVSRFSSQVWTAIGRRLPADQEVPRPDPPGASCTPLRGEGERQGDGRNSGGAGKGEDMGGGMGDILDEVGRRGACRPCLACATFLALGALHLGEPRGALRNNPPCST